MLALLLKLSPRFNVDFVLILKEIQKHEKIIRELQTTIEGQSKKMETQQAIIEQQQIKIDNLLKRMETLENK